MLVNTRWFARFQKTVFAAPLLCAFLAVYSAQSTGHVAAPALPAQATTGMSSLKAVGGGLLRIFGFQVYNAYLWTPEGSTFDRAKPYVLDITICAPPLPGSSPSAALTKCADRALAAKLSMRNGSLRCSVFSPTSKKVIA